MIWIQFAILFAMILIGARMQSIGLGVMGVVGMLIFVLFFHMKPAEPPLDVMMIILSIVTLAATMQACGGLDYLVGIAEKIIRSRPSQITFIAPLVSFVLCLFAGTAHVIYSLLPIIAEVAAKKRIRPERPLSISVVASHLALTGSPMAACTAAMAAILAYPSAAIDVMKICIPAGLVGVIIGSLSVWKMGKELNDDPDFTAKMKDPEFVKSIEASTESKFQHVKPGAKTAVAIFGVAILIIVFCGAFPQFLPQFGETKANFSVTASGQIKMATVIEIITLSASALMMFATGTKPVEVTKMSLFTAKAAALVSVFGVVWMSATFIDHNQKTIELALSDIAAAHPWTFAFAVFIMGTLMFSQAATTKAMMPLGIALGVANPNLIAMFPAVNSDFVLPGYPTLLAAINFDRTGTTKIGKYLFNHSFMRPGLVAISTAVATGFLLSHLLM